MLFIVLTLTVVTVCYHCYYALILQQMDQVFSQEVERRLMKAGTNVLQILPASFWLEARTAMLGVGMSGTCFVWLCGCVVVWLCGCVVVWLCGCVVV